MKTPLYYVGTPEEVAHHARPLADAFDVRIVAAGEVAGTAQPGEVCVFFNEFYPRFRDACLVLKDKGCPTLYAIDGILEWRNSWELPEHAGFCVWVMRPVLADKIACIGRSQARVLESWGNLGKCEVTGVPRFDRLLGAKPRERQANEPFRLLVLTAKCPGFTPGQIEVTKRSLVDLKQWFEANSHVAGVPIEPVWRITQGLEQEIGVENRLADTTGKDLAAVLASVDAVIATPSTAMLEAMLQRLPVALLDYHNCPHYVPAAWTISCQQHIGAVIGELVEPTPRRMVYQDSILHDALECHSPAMPRMVQLVEQMAAIGSKCLACGEKPAFPRRLLRDPHDGHHLPEPHYDHSSLFPAELLFTSSGRRLGPAEAVELAEREGFSLPDETPASDDAWFAELQASCRQWRDVPHEISRQWDVHVKRATTHLERELKHARQEIALLKRQTLQARIERLSDKVRRLVNLRRAG